MTEDWLSIDNAPKDGTVIRLRFRKPDHTQADCECSGRFLRQDGLGCWVAVGSEQPGALIPGPPLGWKPQP
jgi:hypothetical protein